MAEKISIIIPHMNQPEFLERCLASLEPQVTAMAGTDVVVVDNGSRELPTAIVAKYAWVRLDREATPGPGPARNRGIASSNGSILAFIDADCVAHENWLATLAGCFSSNPSFAVVGGDVRIGLLDPAQPNMLESYESVFAYRQAEYISRHKFSGTGNLAMRRAVFERVGPFAGIGVAEDKDWGQRADRAGVAIHYVPEMIVYHPARKTFAELRKKWDRHVVHDFNTTAGGPLGRLRWIGLIAAVGASGVIDIRKIISSDRINGNRQRVLASIMLLRIRLYRAWKMAGLVFRRVGTGPAWNN